MDIHSYQDPFIHDDDADGDGYDSLTLDQLLWKFVKFSMWVLALKPGEDNSECVWNSSSYIQVYISSLY